MNHPGVLRKWGFQVRRYRLGPEILHLKTALMCCGCCLSSDHTLGCKCRDLSEWVASPSFISSRKCPVKLSDKVNKSIVNSPIHLRRVWKSILISVLYFKGKRERDFFINGIMEKKNSIEKLPDWAVLILGLKIVTPFICMTLSSTERT